VTWHWSKFVEKFLSLHILTINRVINLPTIYFWIFFTLLSEWSEPKIGWSGERALQKNDGAERGARGRGVGTEQGAVIVEIGWRAERLFHRSRSAHML